MSNKNKNILLGVLIVGVLSMTVAFAALSTRLNIQGTTNVAATKWNIHFQQWAKVSISTVDGHSNTAVSPEVSQLTMQDNANVTKVTGINVTLNQPGDTAKYTFQIKNEGTIDAKLSNFTPTITGDSGNKINYVVECKDSETENHIPTGNEITVNSVLAVNQVAYCSLEVTYKDVTNTQTAGQDQTYHQDAINASISAAWTWIQDDGEIMYSYQTPGGISNNEPQSGVYLRTSSSNETEVCGVFSNGTVCLINNPNGRYTENSTVDGQRVVSGYTLQKKTEMEEKGSSNCYITSDYVICSGSVTCSIYRHGGVRCDHGNRGYYINPKGTAVYN